MDATGKIPRSKLDRTVEREKPRWANFASRVDGAHFKATEPEQILR